MTDAGEQVPVPLSQFGKVLTAARSRALHKTDKVWLPNTQWDKFFLCPIVFLSVPYRWVHLDHSSVNLLLQLYLTDHFQATQFKTATNNSGSRKVKVKLLSRVRLFATPWTVAHQASPSMGFSRQENWSGVPLPSPGDLPNSGFEPESPAMQADTTIKGFPGKPKRLGSTL